MEEEGKVGWRQVWMVILTQHTTVVRSTLDKGTPGTWGHCLVRCLWRHNKTKNKHNPLRGCVVLQSVQQCTPTVVSNRHETCNKEDPASECLFGVFSQPPRHSEHAPLEGLKSRLVT